MRFHLCTGLAIAALAPLAQANLQETMTLDQALEAAVRQNGVVRAAMLDFQAARARARGAASAFLPTITPTYTYSTAQGEVHTGTLSGRSGSVAESAQLVAGWRIWDNGIRDARYRSSLLSRDATEAATLQTLRQVLFSVHQRYYDALRSAELLRVQNEQLIRAEEILRQTQLRASPEVGDAPLKDVKQAEADALNARVNVLVARNRVASSQASLKAILGLGVRDPLPALVPPEDQAPPPWTVTMEQAFEAGIQNRPDLRAQRKRLDSQRQSLRIARLDAGVTFSVDAEHRRRFADDVSEQSLLVFQASIPLFDGFNSREEVRAQQYVLGAEVASLQQSERDALAEIESAYMEFAQNRERLEAARLAREAARVSYNAARGARDEGAATLIEVLTAQVSLATAESNFVEALYDVFVSEVRLGLATGQPVRGEEVIQR